MTLFAGVFNLKKNAIPTELKASLRSNLRSVKDDLGTWREHDHASLFLVKWDSGAFSDPAWKVTPDGSVCALAGDPLLLESGCRLDREHQIEKLSLGLTTLIDQELAKCRGSFALIQYSAGRNELNLVTDVIGLRPIYWSIQNDFIFFATALRILEKTAEIDKTLSMVGMAELGTFSFPLSERTPYDEISVLRECEILSVNDLGKRCRKYYDWSRPAASPDNFEAAAALIYTKFQDAVDIRAGEDKRVYSFLSGGMDSRAIVATLLERGKQVEALNFSPNGTQDQYYSKQFAQQAGAHCRLHILPSGIYPNFSFLALAAKTELERREATHVDRPQFIWSGDGGSVGLGHVYMDAIMLDLAEHGDTKSALDHFFDFNRIALPSRVLSSSARKNLPDILFNNALSEINRYPRKDIGRCIYLFLLFNDQRRHLFKHFETIDQHGLELLTPFYDAAFLQAVAATPARWGLFHRLYTDWFQHLPEFSRKTPWQTYPGHQPCLIATDKKLTYQWADRFSPYRAGFTERMKLALKILRLSKSINSNIKSHIFSSSRVWIAALAHASGLKDCRYIADFLSTYQQHDAKTNIGNGI
ncbi:MAG: asparagine synthase-related protein [Pseudomonadota bacterium]